MLMHFSPVCLDCSGTRQTEVLPGRCLHPDSSVLAAAGMFPGLSGTSAGAPSSSSRQVRPVAPGARWEFFPIPPRASTSCLAPIQQFTRAFGFPLMVARRLGCARCRSSIANYWSMCSVSRHWCSETGHSLSNPSVFQGCCLSSRALELLKFSVSSIKPHRSILSAVFRF